jgi:cell division protein FtsI (penicillin-binding protein 3)
VITVHEALEHSSDVAAVKLAQKIGQDKFYEYIRSFGFGARTGLELPGETRGLLRPVNRWGTTSYASIAIGQEVGVTPLQLVSMVSTIANGGTYLPPHVLMPGQVGAGAQKSDAAPVPQPFKAGEEVPNPLPQGAHRVIFRNDRRTDAQDDGRRGALRHRQAGAIEWVLIGRKDGHGAEDRSGHAYLLEDDAHCIVRRHCAGQQSVISIAVVMDNPKGASYYGTAVSAPVFADVAQQVLEYLGVPHDIEVHAPRTKPLPETSIAEDDSQGQGDVNSMFAAINDLPSDDPLRDPVQAKAEATTAPQPVAPGASTAAGAEARRRTDPAQATATVGGSVPDPASAQQPLTRAVTVSDAKQLKVPSLLGLPVRKVIEQAAAAGLEVQISGSGTVREQAPTAGTMVAAGTQIAVRCAR